MSSTLSIITRLALGILLFALFPALSPALQDYPPDGTRVVEVEVRGTERTQADQVRRAMSLKAGEPFYAEAARRDIQGIADLGFYNPLTIKMSTEDVEGGVRLIVEVTENPIIGKISFIGNVKYSAERLTRELDYKSGDILPLAARSRTATSLREFYSQGGYKNTSIDVAIDPAEEQNHVNVLITIDEGEKIKIKDLLIHGNKFYPDWRIRTWVINSGSWLFFDNYYDGRTFDDDLRTIENHYRDAGFLDAVARRGDFIYEETKARVSPVIIVSEGPRYRVTEFDISGNTLFLADEVNRSFTTLVGAHFNGDKLREAIDKLRRLYGDQGYVNAEFKVDFQKSPDSGTVKLLINIKENDVVYVGDVLVKKQTYDYELELNFLEQFIDWTSPGVKDETVRREVKLEPGKKYRTADEIRTEERLRALGFFNKVDVYRQPTADPQVDHVIVEVEEDPNAGYVALTAGVGEVTGPSISANYVNPNLFGEARVLKAGATIGSRVHSFNVGYLDRHFMGTDNSFDAEVYRDYVRWEGYGQRIYGTSVEFGHPFSEYVRGYVRPRVENVNLIRREQGLAEDMGSYGVYAVRGMVVRDMINDPRWPTKGYKLSGGIEPGFAQNSFIKFLHSLEVARALDKKEDWVYYYGHNAGLMPNDAERIGISERFFIGGTSTVRGFQPHGIGPRDENEHDVHVGGVTMLTQRHELRRRFARYLSGRLFVDAGVLEDQPFHVDKPRIGTGAGISVNLGALTVDLDLGAAVLKERHDETRVLHFRVRSNF